MRQVIVYSGEDRYFVAECPSLPGCISQGKTREEAIANIKEAIAGYIAALQEDDLPVPIENFLVLTEFVVLGKMRHDRLKTPRRASRHASTTVYQNQSHYYKP